MKLRSLICVSAVAAASAAFALGGANTFARLKVTSDLSNSIIAIPLAGCGETEAKIYVTNLVMTTGLSEGDTLMYKEDGTSWYAWEIKSGSWSPVAAGTKNGVTYAAPNAYMMDCGRACWLIRSSTSNPIYLYGQVNETLPTSVTVSGAADADKFAYTLIAKPSESSALDLNSWHPANAATGDLLLVPVSTNLNAMGQVTYRYNATTPAWETVRQTTTSVTNARTKAVSVVTNSTWTAISTSTTIPAGKGVMYGRKGTSGATLAW